MSALAEAEDGNQIAGVRFDDQRMYVLLQDGGRSRSAVVVSEIAPRDARAGQRMEILPYAHDLLVDARAPDAKPPLEA